jgi:pimeloyl-ACP methyl ester carboxylesterase
MLLLAVAGGFAGAQQVITIHSDIDDSEQPYALYVPRQLVSGRKYPLVISLHSEESNHVLNLRRVFGHGPAGNETEGEASRRFPALPDIDFIVACPLARGSMGFRGIAERDIYDVLADVKRRFPVDEDRIYLTGISTGGGGALWLGLTRPDLWAAIAPVCAEAPPGTAELAGNALDTPIELYHGERDPIVPAEFSRQWQKRFLQLGVHAGYTEYPAVRHNSWERAYREGAIFEVFSHFERNHAPERVRFTTSGYKYDTAWWVRVDRLTPGTAATIDARFTAPNRIEVVTRELDGFTLKPAGHPKFSAAAALEVRIDGKVLRSKGRGTVSFSRAGSGWAIGLASLAGGVKRPGLEGPLAEAVAARHIYVYGTADSPTPEEVQKRRAVAMTAANWSTPRNKVPVSFAVKADKDVTAADIAGSNLVLFGGKGTNLLIARFVAQLPLELNPSAADYGLVFLAPLGGHYVVVNSGLPWWTGAAQVKRSGWRITPAPYHVLESFGDYVVFRGSLEHVVDEGRFDRNWKLAPAAAAKLAATGAVVISPCCQKSFADTATK